MKPQKLFEFMRGALYSSAILVILFMAVFYGGSPVHAATPTIQLTPSSGSPNAWVTISGSGFTPSSPQMKVYVDGNEVYGTSSNPVNASGYINPFQAQIKAPGVGPHTVYVEDGSGVKSADVTFTAVPPTITLTPSSGSPNAWVTISGSGFTPSSPQMKVYVDGNEVYGTSSNPVNASGYINPFQAQIKAPGVGPHTVYVEDGSGVKSADVTFTAVPPTITLTPSSGSPNAWVTISGSGFTPSSPQMKVYVDGNEVYGTSSNPVNASGYINPFQAQIKAPGVGPHTVYVEDGSGVKSADVTFTAVPPTITLTPSSGSPNAWVTISGSGFTPSSPQMKVYVDGNEVYGTSSNPVNASGYINPFQAQIKAPGVGPHTVYVEDGSGVKSADVTFTAVPPTITLTPSSGSPNAWVTISGSGFTPSSPQMKVYVDGNEVYGTSSNPVNASGYINPFQAQIKAPGVGPHTVYVEDGSGVKSADVTFTAVPPTITLTPSSGSPNAWVTISGSGFTPSSPQMKVYVDGNEVYGTSSNPVNASGYINPFQAQIKAPGVGPHTVYVEDGSGVKSADVTFTAVPPTSPSPRPQGHRMHGSPSAAPASLPHHLR